MRPFRNMFYYVNLYLFLSLALVTPSHLIYHMCACVHMRSAGENFSLAACMTFPPCTPAFAILPPCATNSTRTVSFATPSLTRFFPSPRRRPRPWRRPRLWRWRWLPTPRPGAANYRLLGAVCFCHFPVLTFIVDSFFLLLFWYFLSVFLYLFIPYIYLFPRFSMFFFLSWLYIVFVFY